MSLVEVRDLARDYRFGADDVHALRGVTFDIGEGDYVAIVGPFRAASLPIATTLREEAIA